MINEVICADFFAVAEHVEDNSIDLIITDPPYGVGKEFYGENLTTQEYQEFIYRDRCMGEHGGWHISATKK